MYVRFVGGFLGDRLFVDIYIYIYIMWEETGQAADGFLLRGVTLKRDSI